MTLFRIQPVGQSHQYKTWQITAPVKTHFRDASCSEVNCPGPEPCEKCRDGWKSIIDESSELGSRQAMYIRKHSGRTYKEQRTAEGLTVFTFEPHQRCFGTHPEHEHKVRLDRPFNHFIKDGDYRGNPYGTRPQAVHYTEWQERFEEHQDKLATEHSKG